MTEFYLIRHTQAEGNLARIMQGQRDTGITPLGAMQIDALAERFRDINIDVLWSSDLFRTCATAGAITRYHSLELNTDSGLREIMMGPWEDRFFGDLAYDDPKSLDDFMHHPEQWQVDGAETFFEVADRVYSAVKSIADNNPGKVVAVVSHGVAIRCFLSKALGIRLNDMERLPIFGNTAVTHLYYEDGVFRPDYMGDTSHLDACSLPSWGRAPSLRGEAINPRDCSDYYESCYADAWRFVHGSLKGFSPEVYLSAACDHYHHNRNSVMRIYDGDIPAGLIDFDPVRGKDSGYGWISLLYLAPDYRHRGCAPQLLSRAVRFFKCLGRSSIRLTVAESNYDALKFYRSYGFKTLSSESGSGCSLLLLEKVI